MINGYDGVLQRSLSQPETAAVVTVTSNTPTKPTATSSLTASTESVNWTLARPTSTSTRNPVSAPGPPLPAAPDASARRLWPMASAAPKRSSSTPMALLRLTPVTLTQPIARSSTSAWTESLHVRLDVLTERSTTATTNSATSPRTSRTGNWHLTLTSLWWFDGYFLVFDLQRHLVRRRRQRIIRIDF